MNSDKTLSPVGKKTRLKEIHVKKYHDYLYYYTL